ncbi:MAG: hypothetical protein PHX60_14725 [Giesbergeria sp.]|uniref:hypothetical protein n=1 Tax=Giesbergeria sp. TaxID=2818473 RepID=UPI00262C8567|nr:hypothetical protein [Giesbergeria sp.]MDD2610909.1 hypothetical protein [Giesbergeria sp.]
MKFNANAIRQHQAARLLNRHFAETNENILGDGLKLCQRQKAHNCQKPNVAVVAVEKKKIKYKVNNAVVEQIVNVATMHDVSRCGNAHLCAHCTGFKASHMRAWINEELEPACKRNKLSLGLLTLTASHRRDCDWKEYTKKFYIALDTFNDLMNREFKKIGSFGKVRTMESPVGDNGLHLHIHDMFTYSKGADIDKLKNIAMQKWKLALKKVDLFCNHHGVDIKKEGEFDRNYVAKEIASYDSKTDSNKNLKNLFQLLDASAKGSIQAGNDWIRAAQAIQGRDRWNVGLLAKKLNIPTPSKWKKPQRIYEPFFVEYSQAHHMIATDPRNKRAGLAFIYRAARNEMNNPGTTERMVLRMCDEAIKDVVESIKYKFNVKLNESLSKISTKEEKENLLKRNFSSCTFAISEYRASTYNYMYPPKKIQIQPIEDYSDLVPGLELNFDPPEILAESVV